MINPVGLPDAIDKADDDAVRDALTVLEEDLTSGLGGSEALGRRAQISDLCTAAGVPEADDPDRSG